MTSISWISATWKHNLDLQEKYQQVEENEVLWDGYRLEDADVILVSWHQQPDRPIGSGSCQNRNSGRAIPSITLYPFPGMRLEGLPGKAAGSYQWR